ncbi:MAG: M20 family metallopeptidase [Haloarculaceae archaeon]
MDAEVTDLARELVAIPSHDDETAAGDAIEAWLREETDAAVTRDDAGNVTARKGPAEAPSLALVGHHDVVPPDDPQVDGEAYVVEERDGRLYGRGSADMKGAVAAMLVAFRDADPAWDLRFASFVGEEVGGEGAQAAIDRGFVPDYAVVAEGSTGYSAPGVTDVAVAHKGRRGIAITATGASAHAANAEAGENAIYRACDAVEAVRAMDPPTREVLGHELTGSVVVTEIEGGSAMNVVPERCTVTVDARTVPGWEAPMDAIEGLPGVAWETEGEFPAMACEDEAFADRVLAVAASVQPGEPEQVVKPHATDAGWLASAGTTCVVCGPAEPGEAHTADESVSLDVLERCRDLSLALAERGEGMA